MVIQVSEQVRGDFPEVRYWERPLHGVAVAPAGAAVAEERRRLLAAWRGVPEESVRADPRIQPYRALYRSLAGSSAKTRPGVEHLLRRCVLRGFVPQVNNVVDACNIASATFVVPMAVFDLGEFVGQATLRYSTAEDVIQPIGRPQPQRIRESALVLADERAVISIYGSVDSDLYKVRPETTDVLLVACGVSGVDDPTLAEAVDFAADLIG